MLFAIDLMVSLVLNTVTRRVSTADKSSINQETEKCSLKRFVHQM